MPCQGAELPTFAGQPQSADVPLGGVVRLAATVEGDGPMAFAWWKDGAFLPGANAASLTISNAQLADAGFYALVAVNDGGVVMSEKARVVVFANAPMNYPPAWVGQPTEPKSLDYVGRVISMTLDTQGNVLAISPLCTGPQRSEFLIRKFAPDGGLLWTARYAGEYPSENEPKALAVDGANNVYVAGLRRLENGAGQANITIKLDSAGQLVWARQSTNQVLILTPNSGREVAPAVAVSRAGVLYLTSHPVTLAYDTDGGVLWTNEISGESVTVAPDESALFVVGSSGRSLTKMGTNGVTEWSVGIPSNEGTIGQLAIDTNGCAFVSGTVDYNFLQGRGDIQVVKFDGEGNRLWTQTHDGPARRTDIATAICLDESGNAYVAGVVRSEGQIHDQYSEINLRDILVQKYSADGDLLWTMQYDSPRHGYESVLAMSWDRHDGLYLAGIAQGIYPSPTATSSGLVLKLDASDGEILWRHIVTPQSERMDYSWLLNLLVDAGGHAFVGGASLQPDRHITNKERFLLMRFDEVPRLAMGGIVAPGVRQGVVAGPRGSSFEVEGSFDFLNWQVIDRVLNRNGLVRFLDRDDGERGFRFYRARQMP